MAPEHHSEYSAAADRCERVLAFQQRQHNKDSYDLVCTLKNSENGPMAAGEAATKSPLCSETSVADAPELLRERFESPDNDGPAGNLAAISYSSNAGPRSLRNGAAGYGNCPRQS